MVPAAVKKGAGLRTEKYIYLAKDSDEAIGKLSGKKQRQIVKILRERQAFGSDSAVSLQAILTEVGCTNVPVNNLAEKMIIKMAVRTAFRSLPAIPEAMRIETAKVDLNTDQENALTQIKVRLDSDKFAVVLLHGVTDSGKQKYISAIEEVLQKVGGPSSATGIAPPPRLCSGSATGSTNRVLHWSCLRTAQRSMAENKGR
jgi:primosomal protein N'